MTEGFLLTTLIVVASPGTGVAYTLAAGLSHGARASVVAAFGCTLGILPHIAAAMLGLAAVLHASALAFNAVKHAGVAYLLFMAWIYGVFAAVMRGRVVTRPRVMTWLSRGFAAAFAALAAKLAFAEK